MNVHAASGKRGSAAKVIVWSLVLVCVLAACAVGGTLHREIRGLIIGARAALSGEKTIPLKLWDLERSGIPGCRVAYRFAGSQEVKQAAAEAMGMCGGAQELAELAEREGPGSPAEMGLADVVSFCFRLGPEPPPGARVLRQGDGKAPAGPGDGREVRPFEVRKVEVVYALGSYEVEVRTRWRRHVRYSGGPGIPAGKPYGPWRRVGGSWSMLRDRQSERFPVYGGGRRVAWVGAGNRGVADGRGSAD
ncbi:MAG: hypothetical protein ACYTGB_07110 [Planctomycetota bacterium]|jgi:hypothetical protein